MPIYIFCPFCCDFFFPEDFFQFICMPACLCRKMCMWVQVPVEARRGQQIPPELESQVSVSCPMWVLGTNRPLARAKSNSCWVIPFNAFLTVEFGGFLTYLALPSVGITGMHYQAWLIFIQAFCKVNILNPTYLFSFMNHSFGIYSKNLSLRPEDFLWFPKSFVVLCCVLESMLHFELVYA